MIRKILPFILLSFLFKTPSKSQTPVFDWAKQFGGTSADESRSIYKDANGRIYITGFFSGTMDADPGSAVYNLTAQGFNDAYLIQLSSAGYFLWAKQFKSASSIYPQKMVVDQAGNIIIGGSYYGTTDFDPNAGTFNLSPVNNNYPDAFIVKLDNSGNFIWATSYGGAGNDVLLGLSTDLNNNIYAAGLFSLTADFDPTATALNLTSAGFEDIFVIKVDPMGSTQWAYQAGGAQQDGAYSLSIDASANVFVTGYFADVANFNLSGSAVNLTALGSSDIFVLKLNNNGTLAWAKAIGASSIDYGFGIQTDQANDVIITGTYSGTVDFDPGSATNNLVSAGYNDVFILKLSNSGNYIWARSVGGSNFDFGYDVTTDAQNAVYITGYFLDSADFDPGSGNYTLTSAGNEDGFVLKLNASGNFVFAFSIAGNFNDRGKSIFVDNNYQIFVSGIINGTTDFDPSSATFNLTSFGNWDAFLVKFMQPGVSFNELQNSATDLQLIYGDKLLKIHNIITGSHVSISDLNGKIVFASQTNNPYCTVNTASFANGIYVVSVSNNNSLTSEKFLINR
jgi:hypothetical protein